MKRRTFETNSKHERDEMLNNTNAIKKYQNNDT